MSHLQKFTILFFCLFFSLFLACSKENVNNNDGGFPLQLTATQEGRNIKLNWTQTKVSTFEEYVVVRSTEPIPIDFIPTPFSQLVIKRLDEFEENEFTDNNPLLAERIYYKVFVDIGDRFLQSEERVVEYEVTILGGIPGKVAFNAATNMLYILNQETAEVLAYNYVTNESMGKVAAGTSFIDFQPGNNGSGEELYLVNSSNSVKIYDAFSMELKRTISPGSSLFMREVATNSNGQIYIYVDNFPNNVRVLNVENGAIIGTFNSSVSNSKMKMLNPSENELIILGNFELEHIKFSDSGAVVAELNSNTNSFPTNSGGFGVSADGQFFAGYVDGSIFNANLELITTIGNGNSFFEDFAFSPDGTKFFAADNNFLRVQQFSFPDLELEETYNFSYFLNRIFADENGILVIGTLNTVTGTKTIIETINY